MLSSSLPAEHLFRHLTPIVLLGSEVGRLSGDELLPGKNKHIFRGANIEVRPQISCHLLIPLPIGRVALPKMRISVGILERRGGRKGVDIGCRFVQRFVDADGNAFVFGRLDIVHDSV